MITRNFHLREPGQREPAEPAQERAPAPPGALARLAAALRRRLHRLRAR